MEKIVEKDTFSYEIETEKRENGVSCQARLRCFVKPVKDTKTNTRVIDDVEKRVRNLVELCVDTSDILSYNYIADFECTRENLNVDKWSRLKVDLYLMTEFTEIEEELLGEVDVLCGKMGIMVDKMMRDGGFDVSVINL